MEQGNTTTKQQDIRVVNRIQQPDTTDSSVNIQDLLFLYLANWKWFVLAVVIALCCAKFYLLRKPYVFTRSASIMIKEDKNSGSSIASDLSNLGDLGLFNSAVNVNNELISLQSPATVMETVKRLHLDYNYSVDGTFHDVTLYGKNLPVVANILDLPDYSNCSFEMYVNNGEVKLSKLARDGEVYDNEYTGKIGSQIKTPAGIIVVNPTAFYKGDEDMNIKVNRVNLSSTTERYAGGLKAALKDKNATVVELSFNDVSIQRAEDFINTLIVVYNEEWVSDKNKIAISTSQFINERLEVIERELGNVDNDISSYKSEHLIPDVEAVSSLYLTQANAASNQVVMLNNNLAMAKYIRTYLSDPSKKHQLLPVNSGIGNTAIEGQISSFNTILLQHNSLLANSSASNPLVKDLEQQLESMRSAIIVSVDNQIKTLNHQIRSSQTTEAKSNSVMASNPKLAKHLLSVERQQKVKEALYLFLLQKREENELSQAFTAYNTRVITPPMGSNFPTSPSSSKIYLIALAAGLAIPGGIIFLLMSMNTSVRGKKDLENMAAPFAGEIPLLQMPKTHFYEKKKPAINTTTSVVVKKDNSNVINEAFRVMRTNLAFMLGKDKKVIMFTSANPGSGKTFISANLSVSLAIQGKKVVAVDLDMRKSSLSKYINRPKPGVANYLSGQYDNIEDVVYKDSLCKGLDVIPVGTTPPNPAELLDSDRLAALFNELREKYDYVVVDCPPIEIVTDPTIITKHVDMTLFVIRANLMQRELVPEIDKLYTNKQLTNMAVVLNGTSDTFNYGYSKYGYHYGYRYGYRRYGYGSYGYGYGYGNDDSKS